MLPIDRTAKSSLDKNLVNGVTSDAPAFKSSNDVVYNTIDELYNYTSGLIAGGTLQPYPFGMNRQALINGNFDVWQRGTSFTTPGYAADRWNSFSGDGTPGTLSISRQAFAPGQTEVPNNPKYFIRNQVTVAGTGQTFRNINQRIENLDLFSGGKITLSFYAKSDSVMTVQASFTRIFGTGGTPSTTDGFGVTNINLTTAWKKFVATVTVPSLSGFTLGTNGDDCLQVSISFPINTVFTIDIAQVQINAGDQALLFQPRSLAEERLLCQRYYERIGGQGQTSASMGVCVSTTQAHVPLRFSEKRVPPTITVVTGSTGYILRGDSSYTVTSFSTPAQIDTKNALIVPTVASGLTLGFACVLRIEDVGSYISIDAEL